MRLTVLICTHNRASLLERVLQSLNAAQRPIEAGVDLFVVANACSDGTHALLERYQAQARAEGWLPLSWLAEPTPGKSHALNRAIPHLSGDVVAFVDDDHRVDPGYLAAIARAARLHPEANLFCGRILPDWDGREPQWVHDTGPYRIYPLPVPRFDHGPEPQEFTVEDAVPGGGNLALRREVFERVGEFATELGPHGHDLGGGEDTDFVLRAMASGARLRYVPEMVQYHYVDLDRFELRYLMVKGYQRSRSSARIWQGTEAAVPRYMWRKLATYAALALFSINWSARRFYMVRTSAALGEIRGVRDGLAQRAAGGATLQTALRPTQPEAPTPAFAALLAMALLATVLLPATEALMAAGSAAGTALVLGATLLVKSLADFTRTGPQLREEIRRHYLLYSIGALARLGFWAVAITTGLAFLGSAGYVLGAWSLRAEPLVAWAVVAAVGSVLLVTTLQFCRHLLYLPASIAASYQYRVSRLYPLWRRLSPNRLTWLARGVALVLGAPIALAAARLLADGRWLATLGIVAAGVAAWLLAAPRPDRASKPEPGARSADPARPNIVMIGADTLRADRFGAAGYRRALTPFIDTLSRRGTFFTACYVPCARTAPSLLSLLTGTWPHTHGIRDNFVAEGEARLSVPALPELLARAGYATAAVSDWSGADLGKFPLGFQRLDLPEDQWNVKYLIRQGPKDLRLFLSLFTHSRFGKAVLPELYYLAGVPLTHLVGRDARRLISELGQRGEPFFLNMFVSTTHPPFGSEWPYYTLFSDASYAGESKFVMAKLTDPWEIIRRQRDARTEFDLDQIVDLYDGCVRSFDDEVRRVVEHLNATGLAENTIVVIYSDHGMDFFEHDTWGQGNSVRSDASARIPLLIVDPRRRPETELCRKIVRSIDLAPTLLDLVGLPIPAEVDGVSLKPYLESPSADLQLPAMNETGIWVTEVPGMPAEHLRYPDLLDLLEVPDKRVGTLGIKQEYQRAVIDAKDRMIRSGRWKLTYQPTDRGAIYALYDMATDPECRRDVSGAHPGIVEELRVRLCAWVGGRERREPIAREHALDAARGRG